MDDKERKSCIRTIEFLRGLAFNVHGVMDVIDAQNCDRIIEMLNKPEPHWIPCTPETMPKDAGTYLCTCADAGRLMITQIKWQSRMKSWNLTGARTYWNVVAWMPLPEPYQPEEE